MRHSTLIALLMIFACQALGADKKSAPEIDLSNFSGSLDNFSRNVPKLDTAYYSLTPQDRNDGLEVADYSKHSELLVLAKDIADGRYSEFDSILIAHKNKLVFESYYNRGRVNLPHFQASAGKGYIALLVGRAIQLGYLSMEDLHEPVLDFLPQIDKNKLVAGTEKITLHHALSMQSGLRISDEKQKAIRREVKEKTSQKRLQAYFAASAPVTDESQVYKYQFDPDISMTILDAIVPSSFKDFVKTELLEKLGINNYAWEGVSGERPEVKHRNLLSRDMLKLAILMENQGKWKGEQLISKSFLRAAKGSQSNPYSETFDFSKFRYGYYFWGTKIKVGTKEYDAHMAWGGGGQYVMAIQELDLALAITANAGMQEDKTFEVLKNRILPVFVPMEKHNQFVFPELTGPLMGQKPPGMKAEPFAPDIISRDGWELEGVFAPGMHEFYFTTDRGKGTPSMVIGFRQQNNVWKKHTEFKRQGEVTFSPDGSRMYMAKGYKDRLGDEWTGRRTLGPMIDRTEYGIMRLSASTKGTYVFDDYKSQDLIRFSKMVEGKRQAPSEMDAVVNSGKMTAHPFIAPDESYLIWDSEREDGYGESDLYIRFKQTDGSWGPAINMGGNINSSNDDFFATVTPDGKYILFNRKLDEKGDNIDIYWVDAQVIENLRVRSSN